MPSITIVLLVSIDICMALVRYALGYMHKWHEQATEKVFLFPHSLYIPKNKAVAKQKQPFNKQ